MKSSANIKAMASQIISIPREFWRRGNKSTFSLLKDSGYFEAFDQFTEEMFQDVLQSDQKYIQDWLQFSNDKRNGSGWYFKKEFSGPYIVGNFSKQVNLLEKLDYSDPIVACAAYIKREIESIRVGGRSQLNN